MEHIYPTFERGRIMKKELLWALRDYSYAALQLQYQDYPDGIISGCRLQARENMLYIGTGIIKCQSFLFLLQKEESVQYALADQYVSLKFRVKKREELSDYTRYTTEFVLDDQLQRAQNELEICRFKLKEGARLRTEYKDFYDIQTKYDTVNLADADWAAQGGHAMSKEVTDYFAKKVLDCENAEDKDIQFAYFLLHSREAVSYQILNDYIARKSEAGNFRSIYAVEGEEAFRKLEDILNEIRTGGNSRKNVKTVRNERMIIMD